MLNRHIVVVENETLLRDLLAQALEVNGFKVTTAANAADAKRAWLATDADALVIDIELGSGPNGFDLAELILRQAPEVGIVFLTNLPDPRFADRDSRDLPRNVAYLRKNKLVDAIDLVGAINAVLQDKVDSSMRHDFDTDRPFAQLSRKQISVLNLVALGQSNQQIAESRGTTVRAVEGMVSRIFESMGIDPAAEGNARVEATRSYLAATGQIAISS